MSETGSEHIGTPEDRAVEEVGEFLQELSKARRFGYLNSHPDQPEQMNIDRIIVEMEHVRQAFDTLERLFRTAIEFHKRAGK